ncbi:MAG: hypothetical protein DWQ34_00975 [Planctomycetota bacterium]|nr:MAG: hypothetical protein DWQ34_00975 [Planctomycetota bacterium]REK25316.1 MAG: hypothetical protein DWQ41_12280 [Planctomycetota bacterium]REK31805.1 MAG: hypothetical protein DWQ45_18575 [Planctomycetota bacterium]
MIRFVIDTVDTEEDTAEVTIMARPCGVSRVEGESDYGTVTVYDGLGCLLDEEEDDLVDRAGYAMRIEDEYSGDCRWEIISLCCP